MSLKKDILTTGFVKVSRRFLLGFVGTLVLTRSLGPEGLGIYTTLLVVPMILQSLGELGVRQSAAYMTGKKLVSESRLAGALVFLWLISAVLSITMVYIAYRAQGMHKQEFLCVLIGMSLAPAGLFRKYLNGIALGKRWISRINIGETVQVVARVALLTILLLGLHAGVAGAMIVELVAVILPGILMLHWLRKDTQASFLPVWDRDLVLALVTRGFKFAIALFVLTLNYRVSILVLNGLVDPGSVGQFGLGVRIAELIWMAPAAVGMVVFSHSTSSGDPRGFAHTTAEIMRLTLLACTLCALGIGVFCPWFVKVLFGAEYLPSVPVIRIMLPGCIAAVTFKVLHSDLAGRGYPLAALWVYLGALVINVAATFVLIPRWGVAGAAAASSISYVVGAGVYAQVYARMSDLTLRSTFCQPANDWRKLKATLWPTIVKAHV